VSSSIRSTGPRTDCQEHPLDVQSQQGIKLPSFRDVLARRASGGGPLKCSALFTDVPASNCNYNCGARPGGFMRPHRYELRFNPVDKAASVMFIPFLGNDAWNRDTLCNKRGVFQESETINMDGTLLATHSKMSLVSRITLEMVRAKARSSDPIFFFTLLNAQPELRLELEWQVIGSGDDATQLLALRVNGTAPPGHVLEARTDAANPLRLAPGSSDQQQVLTKTVLFIDDFCDGGMVAMAGDATPAMPMCRRIPDVEILGGEDLIPMACAHGLCTKMCCKKYSKGASVVEARATGEDVAPRDASARLIMDIDGVRIVLRSQWRAATSMRMMRRGADLVNVMWAASPDTSIGQRYRAEGGRLELNALGNLQLTIGKDATPTTVWGADLTSQEMPTRRPWCESISTEQRDVDVPGGDPLKVDIMRCTKYENIGPTAGTGGHWQKTSAYTAMPVGADDVETARVPGGDGAIEAQAQAVPTQRETEEMGALMASHCIILPPDRANHNACMATRKYHPPAEGGGGFVDPEGALSSVLCTARAKRWSRVCGWPLPVMGPATSTQAQSSTRAVFVGPPGAIPTASQGVMQARSVRRIEGSFGSFISSVGSVAKSAGNGIVKVATVVGGGVALVAGGAIDLATDVAGDVLKAGGIISGHGGWKSYEERTKYFSDVWSGLHPGLPVGGCHPVLLQVIQFEDPVSNIGDTRTADMLILRHGDAITNYGLELIVINSNARAVITMLDSADGDMTRRELVVGGTTFDKNSWPAPPAGPIPTAAMYTVSVTHAGLRLSNGGLNEADTSLIPRGFTRPLVQARMLEGKETREEWKGIAALLLPIPQEGPTREHDMVVAHHATRDQQGGVVNMVHEVGRYWSSATAVTDVHTGGGASISSTSSTSISTGSPNIGAVGFSFGADGAYSLLQADYEHSSDFVHAESCSMTMTKVGALWSTHHNERDASWRHVVLYVSLTHVVILALAAIRMVRWTKSSTQIGTGIDEQPPSDLSREEEV
jgi:hypothetical protein